MTDQTLAEGIAGKLSPYLGEFNAKIAVRTFTRRAFAKTPDELTAAHVPRLLKELRPMLKTLAGRAATERILRQIEREVM